MTQSNRILVTTDSVGGVWRYALDLANGLLGLGYQPVLAHLGPAPSVDQFAEARDVQVIDTGLPLDWLAEGPAPVLAAGRAIARLAVDEACALVHLNQPSLAAAASFPVPVVAVVHGCVGTWWQAANGTAPDADYAWADALVRDGLHAASAIVAPSAAYAATVQSHHGLPALPLVVHNGRDAPTSTTPVLPAADHVLMAGRLWDRVKNTALLDGVAARLSVPVRAAGSVEGPHGERIASKHLRLLGRLDTYALDAEMAARPIFVSAAGFEPFGLAVLEAAGAGCPLVLSGIATFRELWSGAALFVDGWDVEAWAAAIERVRDDEGLRTHLGEAARLRAARFGRATMADGMAAIYADVLGTERAAAA